jgi:hypothetical protein
VRYDLIVLEPLQAWSAGTTQLYTREFYEDARRRLTPKGILAQWIPFYGQNVALTRSMVASAIGVFPQASLWLDYRDGILILQNDPSPPAWPQFERHLGRYLASAGGAQTPADLLALFVTGPRGLADWARGAAILTDDRPFLEFAAARTGGVDYFRPLVQSIQAFAENPATLFIDAPEAQFFADAQAIRDIVQANDAADPRNYGDTLQRYESGIAKLPGSGLLRSRYRIAVIAAADQSALQPNGAAEVENIYLRALSVDDDFPEAAYNLALIYAQHGRTAEAASMAQRAARSSRVRERAQQLLLLLSGASR